MFTQQSGLTEKTADVWLTDALVLSRLLQHPNVLLNQDCGGGGGGEWGVKASERRTRTTTTSATTTTAFKSAAIFSV